VKKVKTAAKPVKAAAKKAAAKPVKAAVKKVAAKPVKQAKPVAKPAKPAKAVPVKAAALKAVTRARRAGRACGRQGVAPAKPPVPPARAGRRSAAAALARVFTRAAFPRPRGSRREAHARVVHPCAAPRGSSFSRRGAAGFVDRLIRPDDVEHPAVRTVPVRIDIEQGAGRFYVMASPIEVGLRAGEGIEWTSATSAAPTSLSRKS